MWSLCRLSLLSMIAWGTLEFGNALTPALPIPEESVEVVQATLRLPHGGDPTRAVSGMSHLTDPPDRPRTHLGRSGDPQEKLISGAGWRSLDWPSQPVATVIPSGSTQFCFYMNVLDWPHFICIVLLCLFRKHRSSTMHGLTFSSADILVFRVNLSKDFNEKCTSCLTPWAVLMSEVSSP